MLSVVLVHLLFLLQGLGLFIDLSEMCCFLVKFGVANLDSFISFLEVVQFCLFTVLL